MYIKIVERKNSIHTDQTGRVGMTSQSRMQYIMVMVEVNSNPILVETIKNRKSNKLQRPYHVLLDHIKDIKAARIVPKKHVLDNECSDDM